MLALADTDGSGGWGVLAQDRRPKRSYDALREACRPVVAIADPLPGTSTGSTHVVDVHVVNDLRTTARDARVTARLRWRGGERTWNWQGDAPADSVARVGSLQLVVPDVPGPITLSLTLRHDADTCRQRPGRNDRGPAPPPVRTAAERGAHSMTDSDDGFRQHRFAPPPGSTRVLLVRHGESAPARPDRPFPVRDGHGDPPLHPHGRAQAELVGSRLAAEEPIAAIYVTTLQRTHETAAPLAARLGLDPIVVPELREVHLGDWEGGQLPGSRPRPATHWSPR